MDAPTDKIHLQCDSDRTTAKIAARATIALLSMDAPTDKVHSQCDSDLTTAKIAARGTIALLSKERAAKIRLAGFLDDTSDEAGLDAALDLAHDLSIQERALLWHWKQTRHG